MGSAEWGCREAAHREEWTAPQELATLCAARRRKFFSADVRKRHSRNDVAVVRSEADAATAGAGLIALFDRAMPEVYHYLFHRVRDRSLAEDLTAETFLAAVEAAPTPSGHDRSVAWLIGIARHKLADHWRRKAREERKLRKVESEPTAESVPLFGSVVLNSVFVVVSR